MPLVNTISAIIVFVIVVIIAVLLTRYVPPGQWEGSKIHIFMAILAGLSICITFLFYYGVVELNQEQHNLSMVQETARLDRILVEDILHQISVVGEHVPHFASTLIPLQHPPASEPDPITPQNVFHKLYLSSVIFSAWQDILLAESFSTIEPIAYLSSFLQRANSVELFRLWMTSKLEYNKETQTFGDMLFEYALPITDQRPESYITAARAIIADPRYQDL